jgi:hypothetical protein
LAAIQTQGIFRRSPESFISSSISRIVKDYETI